MPSFELKRLSEYTDDKIIAEIQRVASLISASIITKQGFQKYSRVSPGTVIRRFGSWKQALAAAGLADRYNGFEVTSKSKLQLGKSMSDEDILDQLRMVAEKLGRNSITVDEFNDNSLANADVVRRRFGSWPNGLARAGLQVVNHGRRYSGEECFENLLAVWTHYGRPPQHDEMKLPPSTVGPKAYIIRWKTWNRALEAFAAKINSVDEDSVSVASPCAAQDGPVEAAQPIAEEDQHKIGLRLRFKVLQRDNFKCVLCGASPASDPHCSLHVDHIIPWSKGGKTISDNLQTLCADCNLGKGNQSDAVVLNERQQY